MKRSGKNTKAEGKGEVIGNLTEELMKKGRGVKSKAMMAGVMSVLGVIGIGVGTIVAMGEDAMAAITLTVKSTNASFNLLPGEFNESPAVTAEISTTDAGGYNLSFTGPNAEKKLAKSGTDVANGLSSITADNVASSSFTSNQFGVKYCNKSDNSDCLASTNYNEVPGNTNTIIDKTTTANITATQYALAIGAKVDANASIGDTYSGTFAILATSNMTSYNIAFVDALDTNIPNPISGQTDTGTVELPSNVPTKENYQFGGWCTEYTTNGRCSGTTYAASGDYNLNDGAATALYAIWTPKYSITYHSSNGTIPSQQTGFGNQISLAAAITVANNNFLGWCTVEPANDGSCSGTSYSGGQLVQLDVPFVRDLYAMWEINALYMQDVGTWGSTVTTGTTTTAIDSRDNKEYTVGRLADGKLWLLDNLAFDGTSGDGTSYIEMNSTNTNITGTLTWSSSVKGMTADYTNPKIYVDGKNNVIGTATLTGESTWKYGVLYNYAAASAGTITGSSNSTAASQDICPKGWRLPTGGSSGEYVALDKALGGTGANRTDQTATNNMRNALHLPLSGYFNSGSLINQGSVGVFWSSTASNTTNRYYLYVSASYLGPQNNGDRQGGYSVRCVAP